MTAVARFVFPSRADALMSKTNIHKHQTTEEKMQNIQVTKSVSRRIRKPSPATMHAIRNQQQRIALAYARLFVALMRGGK